MFMKKIALIFFSFIVIVNCKGQSIDSLKLYVFLSSTCPMCTEYSFELNKIQKEYTSKGLKVVGIFPNFFETENDIMEFTKKFNISFECKKDVNFYFVNLYKATITPEVFLVNSKDEIIYKGLIDNAYFKPGKKRSLTTENYLRNALEQFYGNLSVIKKSTTAIGCIITKN